MIFFINVALILSTLLTLIWLFVKKRYSYWSSRNVPHFTPSFPFGNFKNAMKTRHLLEIFQEIYDEFKGKAKYAGLYFFMSPAALIMDLDLIKQILIKDFNYFTDRGFYSNEKDDPLSAHLFMLDGEKWRNLRNKISPAFTSGKMKYMFHTMVDVSENLIDTVNEILLKSNSNDLEVKDISARYTTDVIGSCAFGLECNSLKNPNVEFREKGKKIMVTRRHSQIVSVFINTFPNLARKLGFKTTPEEIEKFYMKIVKDTVRYREENNVVRNDFMQLMLQLKNHGKLEDDKSIGSGISLTINEIAAQSLIFFIAGFETSSTVMGYCLYDLAMHQNIQDRLRSEIMDVLKKHDGKITYDALQEMTYLEMCINESMRLNPPAGHLIRKAVKDYHVPGTSDIINKGVMLFLPIYSIQNDPDIFDEPKKYNPERFSHENIKKLHPQSFLPFGDGPRNCVGLRFGKMQAFIGLVALLSNFKFEIGEKTKTPKWNPKSPIITVDEIYLKVTKLNY